MQSQTTGLQRAVGRVKDSGPLCYPARPLHDTTRLERASEAAIEDGLSSELMH